MKKKIKQYITSIIGLFLVTTVSILGLSTDSSNSYTFEYNGNIYEVVKHKLTWNDAHLLAKKRGGHLIHIESAEENQRLLEALLKEADISQNETIAQDGGNSAYVWIGATDNEENGATEGNFSWFFESSKVKSFWKGGAEGKAAGNNSFTNWGRNNPGSGAITAEGCDAQDAVGFAISHWPASAQGQWQMGEPGKWNDISENNELYFVIEYEKKSSDLSKSLSAGTRVYPAIASSQITIETGERVLDKVSLFSANGQLIQSFASETQGREDIIIDQLGSGVYLIELLFENGETYSQKIMKH